MGVPFLPSIRLSPQTFPRINYYYTLPDFPGYYLPKMNRYNGDIINQSEKTKRWVPDSIRISRNRLLRGFVENMMLSTRNLAVFYQRIQHQRPPYGIYHPVH